MSTLARTARDLMERDLISISPETPVLDIHRLFVEEEIHGAPVIGDDDRIHGVVSTLDLLRVVRDSVDSSSATAEDLTAADAMTRELIMVTPDTPLDAVARLMLGQRIHRVFIGTNGVVEGVLTTFDLLHVLADIPLPKQTARARKTGFSR